MNGAFHSEHAQDAWLESNVFKGRLGGTYLECGALDGILHSNSLYFERHNGWRGLLVEANPRVFPYLAQNRPLANSVCCALAGSAGLIRFESIQGPLYGWSGSPDVRTEADDKRVDAHVSTHSRAVYSVAALPLATVLDTYNMRKIDYLSLDVEGSELSILSVFPFERYEIEVIGVEDNNGNEPLAQLLAQKGFRHLARIGQDEIWTSK